MRKKSLFFLSMFLVLFVVSVIFIKHNLIKSDPLNDIINISSVSKEFMDDYFNGTEEILENNNEDNVLIVVSKEKLKNNYGAKKVVLAPNNTYIFEYKNDVEKKEAIKKISADKSVYSVIENRTYTFSEIDDSNSDENNYNSWGIEEAGLSHAIDVVNEKRWRRCYCCYY